jgi:hypothetical protein
MPREASRSEHRNDHQVATATAFSRRGYVHVAMDNDQLYRIPDERERLPLPSPIPPTASPALLQIGEIGAVRATLFAEGKNRTVPARVTHRSRHNAEQEIPMSAVDKNIIRRLGLTLLVMVAASVSISAQDSPSGLRVVSSSTTTQLSQYGITWSFSEPVEYGRYVNGDYWVLGPVEIVDISPASVEVDGRITNGSMVNPSPGDNQSFDSATGSVRFVSSTNVARPNGQPVSGDNPLTVASGSSIVSSISHPNAGERPQLTDAAVLTVITAPPPIGAFRPPYSGADKSHTYLEEQIDTALLGRLAPVADTPAIETVAGYFERPWLDYHPGYSARYLHPSNNMPDYGRDMSSQMGIAALMLHLNYSDSEKRELLINYLQLGIDLWGIVEAGGTSNWVPNGGHANGRKWPILFAGLMFGDTSMQNLGPGDGRGVAFFGEDAQTFYVDDDAIAATSGDSWSPDSRTGDSQRYTSDMLDMPEWGIRHATDPTRSDASWNATYRTCCTANSWSGQVLAARIMNAQAIWDHDPVFDYQDRYMAIMNGDADPFGYTVNGQPSSPQTLRAWTSFEANMWDTYRASF